MKDLIKKISKVIAETYEKADKIDAEIEEILINNHYTEAAKKEKIEELKDRKAVIIEAARRTAEEYKGVAKEEVNKKYSLDPNDITEDIKLLNSGIPLTSEELKALYDRSTTYTMKAAVYRYAEEKGVNIGLFMDSAKDVIERIDKMADGYFNSAISRPQFRDTWLSDEYIESIEISEE